MTRRLRFLFYKKTLMWPFQSGHDVHTFHMMKALTALHHSVGLVTQEKPLPEMFAQSPLAFYESLEGARDGASHQVSLSGLEERFRSYWGISPVHICRLRDIARDFRADVVVVSGLEVLPMIAGIEGPLRIWYAADEWVLHHVSQVRLFEPRSWSNLAEAAIKGAYERAFRRRLDRAWAVSNADRLALRVAGIPRVDVLPNGVDAAHYQSAGAGEEPLTAVFWGRLDFGPNVQALEWFCSRVWPHVKAARRDAQFTIMGFCLTPQVAVLANTPGVRVIPDVPDIRHEVARHAIVVLPFISGGGIKNKLLEAAAMGKAVVCTPGALGGVQGTAPFRPIKRPHDWVSSIIQLWDHPDERRRLGDQARQWVVREHTWAAVAQKALAGVEDSLQSR